MMINNTNNNILWRERQEKIVRPKGDKKSKLSKLINGVLFTTTITTYINNYSVGEQHTPTAKDRGRQIWQLERQWRQWLIKDNLDNFGDNEDNGIQ